MKFSAALFVALLFATHGFATETIGGFSIWRGIMKTEDGKSTAVEETAKIPYTTRAKDPAFSYGFVVKSEDGSDFTAHIKATFPVPTEIRLPDGTTKKVTEYESPVVRTTKGMYINQYTFDDGDPSGIYKIEIYVNGVPLTTVDFDIQPKP